MNRVLALALALAVIAVIAVIAVGEGGSRSATTAPAYGAAGPAWKSTAATVAAGHTKLGAVLVDGRGRTLYLFEKDKGTASTCYGACASIWPPLTTGAKSVAGADLPAAKLGSTKRTDGKTQVSYAGHPLYTYAGDTKSGDAQGQGLDQFGAEWYVLAPSGEKIDND